MKQFTLALLVLFALCVSACGGGGSGSSAPVINDPTAIFPAGVTGANTFVFNPDSWLEKTPDGLKLTVNDVPGLPASSESRIVEFPSGDNSVYRDHGTHIRASVDTSYLISSETAQIGGVNGTLSGTMVITDTLRLGGMKAGLQYSEFGMWQVNANFTGTLNGKEINLNAPFDSYQFAFADDTKLQSFTANSGEQVFSGIALAHARGFSDINNILTADLHGTASLTVDTDNLTSGGKLELSFADFYNFLLDGIGTVGNGFGGNGAPVITGNGTNTTGIVFSPNELGGSVGGNYYGATTPEEAVGNFSFSDGVGKGIAGAFGVVKQP